MQCRECGFQIGAPALFCPACGARLVAAAPVSDAGQGAVQSPSFLGADAGRPPLGAQAPLWQAAASSPPPQPPADGIMPPAPLAGGAAPAVGSTAPAAGSTPPVPRSPLSQPSAAGQAVPLAAPAGRAPASSPAPIVGKPAAPKRVLPQPGDILGDRYRVEKFLGQGSLGNAFLCRDAKGGNREVVIRAMHARKAAEPGLAESYLFLADSVSKYSHRGIARIFASGRFGDTPYYAMEWVSGTPLRMWLMERLTFDNRVLPGLGIVLSLIEIFEAIHERGCYGCLKPENVFIGLSGPVVMDFGVVGFLTPQEFEFNSYARRYLPYMAPELRQDWSNLIPHSDYYSLGAILYEVLTGRAPATPLRLPSELSDLFGIEADEIVLKAMAQKPLDRFGTLESFRAAVESLQSALMMSRPQPGTEGSRSMRVASDANTVLNPDETFSTPTPLAPPLSGAASPSEAEPPAGPAGTLNGNIWSREPVGAPGAGEAATPGASGFPAEPPENPYGNEALASEGAAAPDASVPGEGPVRSAFTGGGTDGEEAGPEGRGEAPGAEAAHAMRRFARSPRGAFPDGELPAPAEGDLRPLSQAVNWEGLAGQTQPGPEPEAEVPEEPVPAWLWIAIALAGCSMVVLSAYFGLLLPR